MNKFQVWILKRIFRRLMQQGFSHNSNIRQVYSLLREAAQEEFVEDNAVTLDCFLHDRFVEVHLALPVDHTKQLG